MNIEIANKLQKLRKANGYSQEELADRLGISRQAVSKWERAEASPDTDNLILLAKIYNVSLDDIISEEDITEAQKEEKVEAVDLDDDDDDDDKMQKDDCCTREVHRKSVIVVSSVTGALYLLATVAFLLIGFLTHVWHPTWVLFLAPIVIGSLISAIQHKNANRFNYPVFMVVLFMIFGTLFNIWHPLWVLFVTIPAYYAIINCFKVKK